MSGQAETYAVQGLIKDVIWLRRIFNELGYPMGEPTVIQVDNAGVCLQSTKSVNHTAAKHYRIAQAHVRQSCEALLVSLEKCASEANVADIFTKALHAPSFLRHQAVVMGPQKIDDS